MSLPHQCQFEVVLIRCKVGNALWWWNVSDEVVPQYVTCLVAHLVAANLVRQLQWQARYRGSYWQLFLSFYLNTM